MAKSNFLPFFPLNLVVFPGELLNLHIFEPRYKQLIEECLESGNAFGMPPYVDGKIPGFGTELRVVSLERRYSDGRMDIKAEAGQIFRIETFDNPFRDKLYAAGRVIWLETETEPLISDDPDLIVLIEELYDLISEKPNFGKNSHQPLAYRIGHRVGLNIEGEYELLTILSEIDRQIFLKKHLERLLPNLHAIEKTRHRIRMNGHFQHFDPLDYG